MTATRRKLRLGLALALPLGLLATLAVPAPGRAQSTPPPGGQAQNTRVVGYNDLGGQGLNGDVTVVGNTAVVATGYVTKGTLSDAHTLMPGPNQGPPCPTVPVKVVDLSNPASPRVTATIPVPAGQAASEVDSLHVSTPAFTGDLLAIAFATCQWDRAALRLRGVAQLGSYAHRGVAYYDVSDRTSPRFLGRYEANFDNRDPDNPPCGPPAPGPGGQPTGGGGGEANCAQDQYSVQLKRIRDGRIISVSTKADASSRGEPSGDVRLVDVTNPRAPVQIGSWPAPGERPSVSGNNGCDYGRDGSRSTELSTDGTRALVPFRDGGLFVLDVLDLANPKALGQWNYPQDFNVEGNAGHATQADVGGRQLSLVSEEDYWWPRSVLQVLSPAHLAGEKSGCSDSFTIWDFDQAPWNAQIHQQPGGAGNGRGTVPGNLIYIGRGCPARRTAPTTVPGSREVAADPYLNVASDADVAGKIVFADSVPVQAGLDPLGCTFGTRVQRAQNNGALAVVLVRGGLQPESQGGAPPVGWAREQADQANVPMGELHIPGFQLSKPAGDAIRATMCPSFVNATTCSPGLPVTGALMDLAGDWGGLRVIDVSNPATPNLVATYRTRRSQEFPPDDVRAIYSARRSVVDGERAYVAWNSDGVRILDLGSGLPVEIASFVPPDTPDPTCNVPTDPPAVRCTVHGKAYVQGVDFTSRHIVVSDMNSGLWVLEKPPAFGGRGYWLTSSDGAVFALGDAPFHGSAAPFRPARPIVGMVPTPSGNGYWLVASDGGVFSFGDAAFKGSTGGMQLNAPIVGMAPTPSGNGYWLVASDGGVFAFGDASFHGSMGGQRLNRPVVGMAATPGGRGYRLVASDGGVFAFGDASFHGSTGHLRLNSPVVGIEGTVSGRGYWMVAADGGIFAFGDAPFRGSMGGQRLNAQITGMESFANSQGYWMVAADGGVFAFNAPFFGSLQGNQLRAPVVAMAASGR